jgi:hypothetical protein
MLLNQPLNTNSLSTNKMPTIFAPTIAQSPPSITKQINPFSMRQFWGLFVLLLGTLHASAQISQVNTPYSKIGIGTLFPTQFAANKAMGGITAAYHSPTNINYDNPSSYARIKLTTFETALQFNGSWLAENTLKSRSATGTLGYLAFAFPAAKFWTMSFGLIPHSSRHYDIKKVEVVGGSDEPIDTIQHRFLGNGQLYQAYLGNGFRIKNLYIGANVGYLFGTINREVRSYFPNVTYAYGNQRIAALQSRGWLYNFGLQYDLKLPKDQLLTIGVSGNPAISVNAVENDLVRRVTVYSNESVGVIDTVAQTLGQSAKVVLPPKIGIGLSYSRPGSLLIGLDATYEQWEDFRYLGSADDLLANDLRLSLGVEIVPDPRTLTKYWRAASYRFGIRYHTGNLRFGEQRLPSYAVTAGIGLPIRKASSRINLSFEAGQTGRVAENIVRETFVIGTVGFSLTDRWFIKPKFD